MSDTDDHARIRALLESGRITEAEAEILFAALDESETQKPTDESAQVEAVSQQPNRPEVPDAPVPPTPVDAQPPLPPSALTQSIRRSLETSFGPSIRRALEPSPGPTSEPDETPAGWVKLLGFCGDLSVQSDPSLGTPVVTGNATLERTGSGYLIRTPPGGEAGGRGWLARLHRAAGDVEVRLPAEMGLELGIAAGDGEVRGVKAIRGTFTGGDFEVSGAEHVDLTVTAGDVTLELRPRGGEQRLRATSGDVDVIFLPGSSVTVSGSATCGDLGVPPTFAQQGSFPGRKFGGTLGAGEARLDLRLTAGDVDIRAEGA